MAPPLPWLPLVKSRDDGDPKKMADEEEGFVCDSFELEFPDK